MGSSALDATPLGGRLAELRDRLDASLSWFCVRPTGVLDFLTTLGVDAEHATRRR